MTEAVVVGASAGAVEALSALLPALPADFAAAMLIVVHLPPARKSMLPELFRSKCRLRVTEAEDKEPIQRGRVYFAPPGYHMLVEAGKTLSLASDDPVLFSRPSIDVLFESAADAYASRLAAIILTGASQDGANGLAAVLRAGGQGLILRPKLAYAATLPEAAIARCPEATVLSLAEIASWLQKLGTP